MQEGGEREREVALVSLHINRTAYEGGAATVLARMEQPIYLGRVPPNQPYGVCTSVRTETAGGCC